MLIPQIPSLLLLWEKKFRPVGLLPPRGIAPSGFRPLRKIPHCCLRRSLGRVSVPVWLIILSDQLPVDALVGRYPTNKLIGRESIQNHKKLSTPHHAMRSHIRY